MTLKGEKLRAGEKRYGKQYVLGREVRGRCDGQDGRFCLY